MSYINVNISWLRRGIYESLVRFLSLLYFMLHLGKDFGKRPIDSSRDLTHVKLFYSAEALKQDDGAMLCLFLTLVQIPLGMGHGVFETWWEDLLVTCLDAGADPILGDVNSATQFWGFCAHSYKLYRCSKGCFIEVQVTEPSGLTQTCLVHLWALNLSES